jgi:hypothetical protein
VSFTPDAAVLTYHVRYKGTYKGVKFDRSVWASSGYARRDGRWRNVFYQETAAPR